MLALSLVNKPILSHKVYNIGQCFIFYAFYVESIEGSLLVCNMELAGDSLTLCCVYQCVYLYGWCGSLAWCRCVLQPLYTRTLPASVGAAPSPHGNGGHTQANLMHAHKYILGRIGKA